MIQIVTWRCEFFVQDVIFQEFIQIQPSWITNKLLFQSSPPLSIFAPENAIPKKQENMAADARDAQNEHPRNGQSRKMSAFRTLGVYLTLVSQGIESSVTRRLSQLFSKIEKRIVVAVLNGLICFQPTDTDTLRNRSRNKPKHTRGKSRTKRGLIPVRSSSWHSVLRLSVFSVGKFRTWWGSPRGDKISRTVSFLLP